MSLCQVSLLLYLQLLLFSDAPCLYSFFACSELITLISSSLSPCSRPELLIGWMCSFDVAGLPDSEPSRCASSFCRSLVSSSCARKKTTPHCETTMLVSVWEHDRRSELKCTCNGEVLDELVRIGSFKPFHEVSLGEFSSDHWSYVEMLIWLQRSTQL